jgi:hypothetical protein
MTQPNMSEIDTAVRDAAKAHLLAKSAFNRAYIRFWHTVELCDDPTGYRLLYQLREHINQYVFKYKRADVGVKNAANEFFRLVAVDGADYSMSEALGFVKWYSKTTRLIGRAIGNLFEFHGDSFGDLCDSLPLAGDAIIKRCLATNPTSGRPRREGFLEEQEIAEAVGTALDEQWRKFICAGENYVCSALEEQARKWWLYRLLTGRDDTEWTPAEQEALSYACHGED